MLFYELNVGDKTYKLRLNTRNIVTLEKDLGKNPVFCFADVNNPGKAITPTTEEMVFILFHSLKYYQPELTLDDAYEIFDKWLAEDNHIVGEFTQHVVGVYKVSGIFKNNQSADEKN